MAAGPISAAELIKINDLNMDLVNGTELLEQAPVLQRIAAVESSNSEYHKWDIKNVGAPADFRAVNDGRATGHSERRTPRVDLEYLDASHETDVQAGARHRLGTDGYLDQLTTDAFQAAFQREERQFFYGKQQQATADADGVTYGSTGGHEGLADFWGEDTRSDKALYQPNVTLVNTGPNSNYTSVWLIRSVNPMRDVATVFGWEGFEMLEPRLVTREGDNAAGNAAIKHGAWWVNIGGMMGFQFGDKRKAYRIANIDATATGTLEVTDDAIGAAISAGFPASLPPNYICMSRQSLRQLRESRTATVQTPIGGYAEFPTESHGIPIIVTDQISESEDEVTKT